MVTQQTQDKRNKKYLTYFFDEKVIPETNWELTNDEGFYHFIGTDVVIEFIMNNPIIQGDVIKELRKADFYNLPILPILEGVARFLINTKFDCFV